MISVILNVYKRPEMLEKQIEAIKAQTIPIKSENIHVWYNMAENNIEQFLPDDINIKTYECSWNTKFWGRFSIIPMLRTEFVAIFDDDIVPPPDWFANCLKTINNPDSCGILGGSGILINQNGTYMPHVKVGWNGIKSDKVIKVDLVGHAWFFKQEWGKYIWYENPPTWDNGEDILFCYLAQKYGNINTFVPPHPENNKNIWCTDPVIARNVGSDKNASWHKGNHIELRTKASLHCINNGWKIVNSK